jgi:hypothetical protein
MSQPDESTIYPRFPKYKLKGGPEITFNMPFFYDAVSFLWAYYKVPMNVLEPYLKGTGLTPLSFLTTKQDSWDGYGLVSVDFQLYQSNLGSGLAEVREVEFSLHCFPTSRTSVVPKIAFEEYMRGQEQTKWTGSFRLWVPASDETAVAAGRLAFGERKFQTQFAFQVPVPSERDEATDPSPNIWAYTVYDDKFAGNPALLDPSASASANVIYSFKADLTGLGQPLLSNPSPLTLYSKLVPEITWGQGDPIPPIPAVDQGRLNASRWNILGLDQTWLHPAAKSVSIGVGTSPHPMTHDMDTLVKKNGTLCALRYYMSPPVAIENRAFWVDPA